MSRGGVVGFLVERCLPVYPVLLTAWVFAAESLAAMVADSGPWRPSWQTLIKVLALTAAGAFLRMADDQKDFDYDRRHHPTRPLVRGSVTAAQLRVAMVPAAALALGLGAGVSALALVLLAAALAYGLLLWRAEATVPMLAENAVVALGAALPGQFLITGFAMTGVAGLGEAPRLRIALIPLVFTAALLHAEIARKTSRASGQVDPHSYAQLIGPTNSALIACGAGLFAVGLELLLSTPWDRAGPGSPVAWLPAATAVLPLLAGGRFLTSGREDFPRVLPTVFVLVFFLSIVVQGLVVGGPR